MSGIMSGVMNGFGGTAQFYKVTKQNVYHTRLRWDGMANSGPTNVSLREKSDRTLYTHSLSILDALYPKLYGLVSKTTHFKKARETGSVCVRMCMHSCADMHYLQPACAAREPCYFPWVLSVHRGRSSALFIAVVA